MRKALVVLSGGQDSATCLARVVQDMEGSATGAGYYAEVHAVTFDYGQRHRVEIDAARRMIDELKGSGINVSHEVIVVPDILRGTSPLVNSGEAVEEYKDAESLPGGLERTFVPLRNLFFLTVAANRAVLLAGNEPHARVDIITGVSQEDYGGYPDCREPFLVAAEQVIYAALDDSTLPEITIQAPLLFETKKRTVQMAERLRYGRMLTAHSRTCYNGVFPPCGKCHSCLLRAKGYAEAGVTDPAVP